MDEQARMKISFPTLKLTEEVVIYIGGIKYKCKDVDSSGIQYLG